MRRPVSAALSVALLLLIGCSEAVPDDDPDVVPRGNRILAMQFNEADGEDFGNTVAVARSLGVRHTSLNMHWDGIETSPGVFAPDLNYLAIGESFYPQLGVSVEVGLSSIDTNNDRRPADLRDLAWDDPQVISRYNALLDWAELQMPTMDITSIAVGNEVDAFLATPSAWSAYGRFTEAVVAHARTLWPDATVGVKFTFDGLTGSQANQMAPAIAASDALMVTYYGLGGNFQVRGPRAPVADFDDLVQRFPGKEIQFLEIGYPADSRAGSSNAEQADFVTGMFEAWDQHPEVITSINFSFLTDFSPAQVDEFVAYYGVGSDAFRGYIGSLGLRQFDGTERPAFERFREEARARGW